MESDPPSSVALKYNIAGCSEHSGRYVAENIKIDSPQDQGSRWSGAYQTANVKQWMLLRLDSLVVLKSITFGKFYKPHPCNMKEFKLYVGMTEDSMTEILHAGLKNDEIAETFAIRSTNRAGITFPTRYVRVEPLSAHGQSFHTSIWFISLNGISDESFVENVRKQHEEYQETVVLRHVLKHLRQRRLLGPFQNILSRSGLQFEHPTITSLHNALVLQGDFDLAESLLPSLATSSLFTSSLLSSQPYASWARIHAVDADGDAPSARSGHAMCIDAQTSMVYLFGGWDGQKNLDDFWVYDIQKEEWSMMHYATARERNGPGPRSCHKMVFDNKTGSIYLFGRLDEPEGGAAGGGSVADAASASHGSGTTAPSSSPVFTAPRASAGSPPPAVAPGSTDPAPSRTWPLNCAEFYRYHTSGLDSGKWDLLYFDTSASGGPPLVFDHQMVMDAEAQVVYVSGGRVVDGDWKDTKYSGLYSYDVRANKWKMFQSDPSSTHPSIPSRYGHSMVLDHVMQTLFIFAGQRDEKYLSDMYAFHIPTSTVTELFPNFTAAGGPEPCFTQRAVCDPELREIYVFCGLSRNRRVSHTAVLESDAPYWIYRYERPERPGKWTKILPYETSPTSPSPLPVETPSPLPRYAHQVVYDPLKKIVYMHGGNAGLESEILVHSYDYDGSARDRDRDRDGGDDIRTQSPGAHREVRSPAPLGGEGSDGEKENRLDDFWRMKLIRPSPEDNIRRCRYLIRQQKFRELCANAPPLKALAYLQTDVSSVVDHSDAEETRVFRSLLSHLLIPSAVTISAPATPPVVKPYQGGSPMKTTPDKELEEDEAMTDSDTGVLASKSGGEAIDATRDLERPLVISMDRDPEEKDINGGIPSSAEQFKQREKLFEMLMEYIDEDAKQPDRDLMRLINVDGDDL